MRLKIFCPEIDCRFDAEAVEILCQRFGGALAAGSGVINMIRQASLAIGVAVFVATRTIKITASRCPRDGDVVDARIPSPCRSFDLISLMRISHNLPLHQIFFRPRVMVSEVSEVG